MKTDGVSPMEMVRQFIAAFAGRDAEALLSLLAPHVYLRLQTGELSQTVRRRRSACEVLLTESSRWVSPRVDMQNWAVEGDTITLQFQVQWPSARPLYLLQLTCFRGEIGAITLERNGERPLPAWKIPARLLSQAQS